MWEVTHSKPAVFYDLFERKGGDLETTHYCPGCGHGVLHKLIAESLADLGVQDRTILVSPVGCAVFAYYYLDVGNVQASHGRAPAVATGIKRVRPESIVLCYQGDGDLAAIGGNEILHAANRGENITVFFVNNAIYGMTGGQMAPTTPLGERTSTSPKGRKASSEGFPLRMCELLATLEAPVYIERVALTDAKNHMKARKAVRRAIRNQMEKRGFSFVEVLSACPTGWGLSPAEAVGWLEDKMIPLFPVGTFRERPAPENGHPESAKTEPGREKETGPEETSPTLTPGALAEGKCGDAALKISGFGGQGIMFLGALMAEAGMREGLKVSWIPSYGPEMRGGTAHCHVRLARHPISSPLISRPSVLMAFNEPSAERFEKDLLPGGLLMLNSSMVKKSPGRSDVTIMRVPATEAAKDLGNPRVANMIMLGAYLHETRVLNPDSVLAALRDRELPEGVLEANRAALRIGRDLVTPS